MKFFGGEKGMVDDCGPVVMLAQGVCVVGKGVLAWELKSRLL